jgi:hypothetical protein
MSQPAGPADVQSTPLRLCPACDYDLRGIQSSNCPECGLPIGDTPALRIPWQDRQELGRVRAFSQTVYLAIFHPMKFSVAVGWQIDLRSAYLFRLWVSVLAAAPPILILLMMIWHYGGMGLIESPFGYYSLFDNAHWLLWEMNLMWVAGATLLPILPIGAMLAMWLITGSAKFWFTRGISNGVRRERAAAISFYACAPLALLFVPAAALGAMVIGSPGWQVGQGSGIGLSLCAAVSVATGLMLLIAWWWRTVVLMKGATRCGWMRSIMALIGLPIFWSISALLGLMIWPCLAGLIWIAVDGFRK